MSLMNVLTPLLPPRYRPNESPYVASLRGRVNELECLLAAMDVSLTRESEALMVYEQWTERERNAVKLICAGKTNGEISKTLGISLPLVKKILSSVFLKTKVDSRLELNIYIQNHPALRSRLNASYGAT